jgi:very-short-patch-repair endonuclease
LLGVTVDRMNMTPLPVALAGKIFSRAEAETHGLSPRMLRGSRVISVWPGRYRYAETPVDDSEVIEACLELGPPDAALSHTSALAIRGLSMRPLLPVHVATNTGRHVRRRHVIVHRFQGALDVEMAGGLPLLGAARTFVDCATMLTLPELVAVGDWMAARRLTTPSMLRTFADESHLDGVQKARLAAELVRAGSESVQESVTRFDLVANGLPEPAVNLSIQSDDGQFLARGDLPYPQFKVLVEYDGWYHERSAEQRQRDILRRELLEAHGWLVVVLTSRDLADPRRAAWRVFNALRSRGYDGPPPRLDARFGRWIPVSPR